MMSVERAETTAGREPKVKAHKFLGSLKDALLAAGRDETATAAVPPPVLPAHAKSSVAEPAPAKVTAAAVAASPSAEEAARIARTAPAPKTTDAEIEDEADAPPTTRVLRGEQNKPQKPAATAAPRTVLVRGKQKIAHDTFERDPVVGFLVIVGGPGLGSFRPIFEGNNTLGRSLQNRIPLDFGDDAISSDAQAYLRYDSNDRSFLFVPNLAKTNVVSVNEKRPTGAVPLQPMDVITLGRTQVAFVPFCGSDFDWSEISEA